MERGGGRRRRRKRSCSSMESSSSTAAPENAPAPVVETHDSPKKGEAATAAAARSKDSPSPTADAGKMPAPVVAKKKGEEEEARSKLESSPSTAAAEITPAPTVDDPPKGDDEDKEEARSKLESSPSSTAAAENAPATSPTLDDPKKEGEPEAERSMVDPSPSSTAAEKDAPATAVATPRCLGRKHQEAKSLPKEEEEAAARSMDPSPSTAVEKYVPAPAVATPDETTKEGEEEEEQREARTGDSSPSIAAAENAPAPTVDNPKKGEEEEGARGIDPASPSAASAEEGRDPSVATHDKPNKGKAKVEEAGSGGSSSSTVATEDAATSPSLDGGGEEEAVEEDVPDHDGLGTLDSPLRIIVGRRCHLVVVTNRADEASEWVRRLPPVVEGKVRVIGVSSYRYEHGRRDGYVHRRVVSLHLSYLARVLVYYLGPPERTFYSPEVMSFLRHPSHVFVGSNVNETLYLLGVPYRLWSRQAMELVRVAQILEVGNMIHIAQHTKVPLHILLAVALLNIRKDKLRADKGPVVTVEWPPAAGHVEFAVETAVVSQSLGIRAYIHETMPPQQ